MNLDRLADYFHLPNTNVIGAYVVAPLCAKCGEPPRATEFMLALPKPYHCLLHVECVNFFNFNQQWPHPFPAHYYTKRGRRRSSPPALTESQ